MIEVSRQGDALVIKVIEPQLQMYAIPQFRTAVTQEILSKPKLLVFDLAAVDHLDSSAMGALFHFQKELKSWDGKVSVANLSSKLLQIFKITKSENAFGIFDSVEEALKG